MRYLILSLLIAVAIFALWFQQDIKKIPSLGTDVDTHFPDYFMENFKVTNMDQNGDVEYIIEAKKMLHYADNGNAELNQPHLTFYNQQTRFDIDAGFAEHFQQENLVHLQQNVVLRRTSLTTKETLTIYTDQLKINTETQVAETDQLAKIKTAQSVLNTRGLRYDNKNGILQLKSQVKGVYEVSPL